jgi:hypothetical protein
MAVLAGVEKAPMSKRKPADIDQDTTPAEWIEAVLVHPGYREIRKRLELMLTRRRLELEQPCDSETTAGLRGRIDELKTCLNLPAILKKELEAQPK